MQIALDAGTGNLLVYPFNNKHLQDCWQKQRHMTLGAIPSQFKKLEFNLKLSICTISACLWVMQASISQAAEPAQPIAGQQIVRAGSTPSVPGPDATFTGRVRVDQLWPASTEITASGAHVTFEPGARSAWHTHPAGQRLVVVSGVGRTQEWGKPIQELRAGDSVWCPPGVKHWHGASPTVAMTHLAVSGMLNGKNVEWMEKVTDDQYTAR